MSDHATVSQIRPGSGTPFTARGRSIAYGPPPWNMSGRTVALWYRLADPDEARRHVPRSLHVDPDPVVRVRFWDLTHDGDAASTAAEGRLVGTHFREAVVAFPVRYADHEADYPTYMYADDFIYTAFGREVMGWPIRSAAINISEPTDAPLGGGTKIRANLARGGSVLMRASLELTGARATVDDDRPPSWLAVKVIPDVAAPRAAVAQLVATGPGRIRRPEVWVASAQLELPWDQPDELRYLTPREIVAAQYWVDVELTVEHGRVLAELGEQVWNDV